VPLFEGHFKVGIGQGFFDYCLNFNGFFFWHWLSIWYAKSSIIHQPTDKLAYPSTFEFSFQR
jgi:hypothetical protein